MRPSPRSRIGELSIWILFLIPAISLGSDGLQTWGPFGEDLLTSSPVVEVVSTFRGTGTVVLINGKPRILTSSHVLYGQTEATIHIPVAGLSIRDITVRAEFDSPLGDIAVLALKKSDREAERALERFTDRTGSIECKRKSRSGCEARFVARMKSDRPFIARHSGYVAFVDGEFLEPFRNPGPTGYMPLPDLFVSGFYSHLNNVDLPGRPGMSGGADYDHGVLKGILTKFSWDLNTMTLAIPIDEVARLVASRYFKGAQNALELPPSSWGTDPRRPALEVKLPDEHLIESQSDCTSTERAGEFIGGGGDISGGGGDISGGGGDISGGGSSLSRATEKNIWIDFKIVPNPFATCRSEIRWDRKPVAYFERDGRLIQPNLPLFLRSFIDSPRDHLQPVLLDDISRARLTQLRAAKFASFEGAVTSFEPVPAPRERDETGHALPKQQYLSAALTRAFTGSPARLSIKSILAPGLLGLPFEGDSSSIWVASVSADMRKLSIIRLSRDGKTQLSAETLKAINSDSAFQVQFVSSNNKDARATLAFSTHDITRLDFVEILFNDKLYDIRNHEPVR